MLCEPRLIRILDLHTSRELDSVGLDDDVDDFAIDRDGQTLPVRRGNGSIELHQLADLPTASLDARTTAPPSRPQDISSPSPADTVPDMRANLFDFTDTDDEPTVNIR